MGFYIFYSLLIFALSFFVLKISKASKRFKKFFAVSAFLVLFLNFLSLYSGGIIVDASSVDLIFYLKEFFSYTVLVEYKILAFKLFAFFIISIAAAFSIYKLSLVKFIKLEQSKRVGSFYVALLLVISVITTPVMFNFFLMTYRNVHLSFSGRDFQGDFDVMYKDPMEYDLTTKNKPNIIYVYLESLERSYLDKNLFPGLADEIREIESKSLRFTNVETFGGGNITIAGMVATQCGIPFVNYNYLSENVEGGETTFLEGVNCIGDIFNKAGYNLSYVGGADIAYSGKGNFYKTHGFSSVEGKFELEDYVDDKDYYTNWGMYDDDTFEVAYDRFVELASKKEPFGLFMLTLDTHGYDGYVSDKCKVLNSNHEVTILNSVRCTSYLFSEFFNKVRNSGLDDNTIIVVSSDHLSPHNASDKLANYPNRRNLFFVNFPDNDKAGVISKRASKFDIGPTILDLFGFGVKRVGFGKSLLTEQVPLVAQKGKDIVRYILDNYLKYWNFIDLKEGVAKAGNKIYIGGKNFSTGVMVYLDRDKKVDDIFLGNDISKEIKNEKISILSNRSKHVLKGQRIIWLDRCTRHNFDIKKIEAGDVCLYVGRKGAHNYYYEVADNLKHLSFSEIEEYIN